LPPRLKDTKDFILLFFLSVLVPGGEQKKVLPQKAQNLQLRNYRRQIFKKMYIDLDSVAIYGCFIDEPS